METLILEITTENIMGMKNFDSNSFTFYKNLVSKVKKFPSNKNPT